MSQKEPDIEEEVIKAIIDAWKSAPSMRLTQLLVNAINPKEPCPEVFYVDDSKLIELLNKFKDDHS